MGGAAVRLAGGPLSRLLVATTGGLYEADGPAGLQDRSLVALAGGAEDAWALDRAGTILRSDEGPWEEAGALADPSPRCVLPHEGGVLVGTAEARLFRLRRDVVEPVEAFDEVDGRARWFTPWGGPPDTRSLTADSAGTIYANVHVGGIVRSTPEGAWRPTIDIETDVHQVIAHPDRPELILAATAFGLARSDDGGETWAMSDEGLHAPYSRAVAVADDAVLITASTGPRTRQAAVYRRPLDGAGPFERAAGGLPEWFPANIDSYALAADGPKVAFGTADGQVWTSGDHGRTWELAHDGLPRVTAMLWSA
jgi:hypothetical protein